VTKRPGSRVYIPPESSPVRLFRCLKRSIASRVRAREPRLEAVLYPASGSGSGPASRPSPRSGTPISRALPAQTSHEHVGPCVVNNQIEFMCLRESSDSADPFISATAIQPTPSYATQAPKARAESAEGEIVRCRGTSCDAARLIKKPPTLICGVLLHLETMKIRSNVEILDQISRSPE